MQKNKDSVLILGSGRSVEDYHKYANKNFIIVAVNNAWAVTEDYDYWIRPGDYYGSCPDKLLPHQKAIGGEYNKALNKHGGVNKCGFSMMLAASYWVLEEIKPNNIYYLGADMNYRPDEKGNTHFYGKGYDIQKWKMSDPDLMVKVQKQKGNKNPNYLNDIYMRFYWIAEKQGTKCYNLSKDPDTRLPYPKIELTTSGC